MKEKVSKEEKEKEEGHWRGETKWKERVYESP